MLDQDRIGGCVGLAVLLVALTLPFVLFTPDYPLAPQDRELQLAQDGLLVLSKPAP